MKSQAHRDEMQRRKVRRVYTSLKHQFPNADDIDLRAQAMSEVSGVPVEDCRAQLLCWATGKPPQVSQWERCAYAHCDMKASRMATSNGLPFCWHHAGEWTQSYEAKALRESGGDRAQAIVAFAKRGDL